MRLVSAIGVYNTRAGSAAPVPRRYSCTVLGHRALDGQLAGVIDQVTVSVVKTHRCPDRRSLSAGVFAAERIQIIAGSVREAACLDGGAERAEALRRTTQVIAA